MECRLETITPKKAAEFLKINTYNRPVREKHVKRLADAMLRGEWKLTGDTIKMNGATLVDGQHRLWAVVKSGVSIQSYIARGVSSDAYACIDQIAPRSVADHFGRDGEKHYTALSAAVRFVHCYRLGEFRAPAQSPQQAQSILDELPQLRDSVHFVLSFRARGLGGPGPMSGMHCLMSLKDSDAAHEFWTRVLSGEGLTKSMPEWQIRNRMIENGTGHAKLRPLVIYAMTVKAWNAKRKGASLKFLRWTDEEKFPVIE